MRSTPIRSTVVPGLLSLLLGLTACGNSVVPSPPAAVTTLAQGGGGGTATPPPVAATAIPTISITTSVNAVVGQTVVVNALASSEGNQRKSPALTLTAAPAGATLVLLSHVDSPHGGGPGYTLAEYTWTPGPDQAGTPATFTFVAQGPTGATSTKTADLGLVQAAP